MWYSVAVLVLFTWGNCCPRICAKPHLDENIEPPCKVVSPLVTPHVSAYLEQGVRVTGCVSNSASDRGSKLSLVDAIIYHGKQRRERTSVDLIINKADLTTSAIIVLSTTSAVRWHVKLDTLGTKSENILIILSKGSGIRFANKNSKTHPRVEKQGRIPAVATELLPWLQEKFGAVRSLNEVAEGTAVTLTIKDYDANSSAVCDLTEDRPPLPLTGNVERRRQIDGCVVEKRRHWSKKLAYIVELKEVHQNKPFEVNLEISSSSPHREEKEFWLVLKSPSHVTWNVHTRKLQGYINIVANSFVEISGVKMRTVGVRAEELLDTGPALLRFVEYFIGPVMVYASINNSNHIMLTLPEGGSTGGVPDLQPIPNPFMKPEHTRTTLQRAMHTECSHGNLIVAIDKIVVEMLGLGEGQITLSDRACSAMENRTHLFAQSPLLGCGTRVVDNGGDMTMFLNSLVVHSGKGTRNERIKEGSGNTNDDNDDDDDDDIYSGSGDNTLSDVYVDDEDLSDEKIEVEIMCSINTAVASKIELYESIMFARPIAEFPFNMQHKHSRLYLQTTTLDTPFLRALPDSCWLSPFNKGQDTQKYPLIEDRCPVDSTVSWHNAEHLGVRGSKPQSQRLSFTLENYAELGSSPEITFLKCRLTYCCISTRCGHHTYPLCDQLGEGCGRHRHGHSLLVQTSQLIVLGPLHLAKDKSMSNNGVPMSDVAESKSEAPSRDKQNSKEESSTATQVVIEGLDSLTVVGIAFGAFVIGVLMMGALWYIHSHPGTCNNCCSLNVPRRILRRFRKKRSTESANDYGESTPGSSAPIST